jgi:3-hydroxyisobutyrate/3-hydroxypropionate dehydrogenase
MGFPMASNLRKKIPKESTLYVNDVDTAAVDRFVKEHSSYGPVKVLSSAKEITEHSVPIVPPSLLIQGYHLHHRTQGIPRQECLSR